MRKITALLLSVATLLFTAATFLAHEVTYKGTVVAVEPNRYAAADGVVAKIEVKVIDRKRTIVFEIVQWKTKLFRGQNAVSFTEARIQKDERVAVTVNHDEPGEGALEIRLEARK